MPGGYLVTSNCRLQLTRKLEHLVFMLAVQSVQALPDWFCSQNSLIIFWNSLWKWLPNERQQYKLGLKLGLCLRLPPEQQVVKLLSALKSLNQLGGVWILFRSVENTKIRGKQCVDSNPYSLKWGTVHRLKSQMNWGKDLNAWCLRYWQMCLLLGPSRHTL